MENKAKNNERDAHAWKLFIMARGARARASQLSAEADDQRIVADTLSRRAKQLWREIREEEGWPS